MAEEFHVSFKADPAETTPLGAPLCLHYGESKFSLYCRQSVLFAKHLLCRHTPFKIKTLVSCIRFFTWFSVCCSLVRVTTRWWTLMVAAHLLPLYLGESVFPKGFRCYPLRSFPVLSFLKVCHLGAWWFRGFPRGSLSLPVILWVPFSLLSCRIPFSCFGGGGRKNLLLTFIIMHSCNPNDRFGL